MDVFYEDVFNHLDPMATTYRKPGLSGMKRRRNAAEREGKVHIIRNIRQLVTFSEPKVKPKLVGMTNLARSDANSIPTIQNAARIMTSWLRCFVEKNSEK